MSGWRAYALYHSGLSGHDKRSALGFPISFVSGLQEITTKMKLVIVLFILLCILQVQAFFGPFRKVTTEKKKKKLVVFSLDASESNTLVNTPMFGPQRIVTTFGIILTIRKNTVNL